MHLVTRHCMSNKNYFVGKLARFIKARLLLHYLEKIFRILCSHRVLDPLSTYSCGHTTISLVKLIEICDVGSHSMSCCFHVKKEARLWGEWSSYFHE